MHFDDLQGRDLFHAGRAKYTHSSIVLHLSLRPAAETLEEHGQRQKCARPPVGRALPSGLVRRAGCGVL